MNRNLTILIILAASLASSMCFGELKINPIFSDGMVLQRGMPIKVWGTAEPKATVMLAIGDEKAVSVTADIDGFWEGALGARRASTTPTALNAVSGDDKIVLGDVLIGDVWLTSGQSNMGFKLENCIDGEAAVSAASDKLIRVNNFRKPWEPCTGEVAATTSGVAYFFARKLRQMNPEVPIGLINRALSGSPIEGWIPVEELKGNEFSKGMIERFGPESEEGQQWKAYADNEAARKRAKRKGEEKEGKVKRVKFEGGDDAKVLAEIYYDQNPGRLWHGRIAPFAGYSIAGVIWYQGERNSKAGRAAAENYGALLELLVGSWRKNWGQGDFRFLAVQLPPFEKGGPNWKIVQSQQVAGIKRVSNADIVDLLDLPDKGLHPPNKRPVGERVAEKATAP